MMKKEVILSMILPTVVATFHPYIFLIPHSMIPWMLMVNYHKEILEFCILRVVSTIGPDVTTGSPSQPSPSTVPPPQNNPPPPPPNNQPFDPPEVPTFFNRTALFCWFISVLTAILNIMVSISHRYNFNFETNLRQTRQRSEFLAHVRRVFETRSNATLEVEQILLAFIRECLNNQLDRYFRDVGEVERVFTAFDNSNQVSAFFEFIQPLVSTDESRTGCYCTQDTRTTSNPFQKPTIELKEFLLNRQARLQDMVEEFFSVPTQSVTTCQGCQQNITLTNKTNLLGHPQAIVVCLGRIMNDGNGGIQEVLDRVTLGNDLTLRAIDDTEYTYTLWCCVAHHGKHTCY